MGNDFLHSHQTLRGNTQTRAFQGPVRCCTSHLPRQPAATIQSPQSHYLLRIQSDIFNILPNPVHHTQSASEILQDHKNTAASLGISFKQTLQLKQAGQCRDKDSRAPATAIQLRGWPLTNHQGKYLAIYSPLPLVTHTNSLAPSLSEPLLSS